MPDLEGPPSRYVRARSRLAKRGVAAAALLMAALAVTSPLAAAPLPLRDQFLADPSAHVFKHRLYLYLTNDSGNDGQYWNSRDWRALSSADGLDWTDHGAVFDLAGFAWAKGLAWAPTAAQRDGRYLLYLPVDRSKIGVAVSDTPTGPFKDAIGRPLIDNGRDANAGDEPIDPAVFIDDDGQAYLYFGTRVPKIVRLSKDMTGLAGPIEDLAILGARAPYGEAPWLHKRAGVYYFSYSTGWPGQIVYATASSPAGPFVYRGVVLDYVNVETNHQSIVTFKGRDLIFYHRNALAGGGPRKRSVVVAPLQYRADGSIVMIKPEDPPPGDR